MTGFGMQWHQLDHMQTICTSLQTDNHINPRGSIFTGRMLFLTPNHQCQSTEGKCYLPLADLGIFTGGDFGNPSERRMKAYGRMKFERL